MHNFVTKYIQIQFKYCCIQSIAHIMPLYYNLCLFYVILLNASLSLVISAQEVMMMFLLWLYSKHRYMILNENNFIGGGWLPAVSFSVVYRFSSKLIAIFVYDNCNWMVQMITLETRCFSQIIFIVDHLIITYNQYTSHIIRCNHKQVLQEINLRTGVVVQFIQFLYNN